MSNVVALRKSDAPILATSRIAEGMNESPYLSPLQVTEYLPGTTTRQLQEWRSNGRGPRYAKTGKVVVYRRADLDAWVNANLVDTRDQS